MKKIVAVLVVFIFAYVFFWPQISSWSTKNTKEVISNKISGPRDAHDAMEKAMKRAKEKNEQGAK